MNTHAPPRVERIINAPDPRVVTHQRPTRTIPLYLTTRYRSIEKIENRTPQEEMDVLENLTEIELTHLFSGLGVTES